MDEAKLGGVEGLAAKIEAFQSVAMLRTDSAIDRIAKQVVAEGLSVRALEDLLNESKPKASTTATAPPANAHLADLEKRLSRELGLKVQVRSSGKGKGKITIRYGSLEQFDELMERMKIALEE